MGSKEFYTAADFLSNIEERVAAGEVSTAGRKILLRDMPEILEAMNEDYIPGPVRIKFAEDHGCSITSASYKRNYWGKNGVIYSEEWNDRGRNLHRDNDKPALIYYYENSQTRHEGWFFDNRPCREGNKPTKIFYNTKGEITDQDYQSGLLG